MSQIILSFNSINWGRFIISYFKDSYIIGNSKNGILTIFFDYELIKHDYLSNKEIINFAYDFPPGNHQILIIYKYFRESDYYNKPMKLYVRSLELINIKESSIECIKEDIKRDMFKCDNNYFYNENTKKCEKCKEGENF